MAAEVQPAYPEGRRLTILPRVHVIATGGTIAGKLQPTGEVAPGLSAQDLLQRIPGAASTARVTVENLLNVASAFIGFQEMLGLAHRVRHVMADPDLAGIVVTHGTGTLEQTAYFLDVTLGEDRPIVVTGAMRNPTLPSDDGPMNLLHAVQVAASPLSASLGVLVVLNSTIHAARDVTKVASGRADAFQSPEFGPLGAIDEEHVFFARRPFRRLAAVMPTAVTARVERIPSGADPSDLFLRAAVDQQVDGLIIDASRLSPHQLKLVDAALDRGIVVVMANPYPTGRLPRDTYRHEGGESDLLRRGVIFAGTPGHKARVKLTVLLSAGLARPQIRDLFHAEWE